ncbi:MAG: hypothetical protein PHC61_09815 [Chitinivibrionales bacterium]|nr:hypothetical protein [Chitinivibrionales bacterium]
MDKAQHVQGTGADETLRALNVLVENLVGEELRALHSSFERLSNSMTQQVEGLKRETSSAMSELRKDMNGRMSDLTRSLEAAKKADADALSIVETRMAKSIGDLDQNFQKTSDQLKAHIASVKNGLDKSLTNQQQIVRGELDMLKASLTNNANDISTVRVEVKRASAALANMARVFSGAAAVEEPARAIPPQPALENNPPPQPASVHQPAPQPEAAGPKPGRGDMNVYNLPESSDVMQHLDNMFNPKKK